MKKSVFEISWGSLWKIVLMLLLVTALFYIRDVVVLVAVALVVSSALYGPVSFLEKKKIPRLISVTTIFVVLLALLVLVLYTLVPAALIQLRFVLTSFNDAGGALTDVLGTGNIAIRLSEAISQILDSWFSSNDSILTVVLSFIGNLFYLIVLVVLSFYLTISKNGVERFIRALFPPSIEEEAVSLYVRTRAKLAHWLNGQLLVSLVVGILTFVGLFAIGSDYALILALLAAMLELVPYVGPIVVGVIAFLISLPTSVSLALATVIVFTAIQQIENHALTPVVMSKTVGLEPVTVVIAILAGSQLAGLAGIILAVPFAIVFQELVDEWAVRKRVKA